jgi:hypothetical protein
VRIDQASSCPSADIFALVDEPLQIRPPPRLVPIDGIPQVVRGVTDGGDPPRLIGDVVRSIPDAVEFGV